MGRILVGLRHPEWRRCPVCNGSGNEPETKAPPLPTRCGQFFPNTSISCYLLDGHTGQHEGSGKDEAVRWAESSQLPLRAPWMPTGTLPGPQPPVDLFIPPQCPATQGDLRCLRSAGHVGEHEAEGHDYQTVHWVDSEPLHPDSFPGTDEGSQYDRIPSVATIRREVASACSSRSPSGLPCCRQAGHTGRHVASNGLVWVEAATVATCSAKSGTGLFCRKPTGHDGRHETANETGMIVRWAIDSKEQVCTVLTHCPEQTPNGQRCEKFVGHSGGHGANDPATSRDTSVKPIEASMLEAARAICRDLWGYSPQAVEDVASVLVEPADAFRMAFLAGLRVADPILRALVDDQRIGIIARQARQLLDEMDKINGEANR